MSNPALLSKDGTRNAFYLDCRVHGQRRPYAVCLHRADRHAVGESSELYPDCDRAIEAGTCQALAMHREELEKGQPIYFVERKKEPLLPPRQDAPVGTGMTSGSGPVVHPSVDLSAAAPARGFRKGELYVVVAKAGTGKSSYAYADAINAALTAHREAVTSPAPAPITPTAPGAPKPPALPGESPLAYARRIQPLQQGTTA